MLLGKLEVLRLKYYEGTSKHEMMEFHFNHTYPKMLFGAAWDHLDEAVQTAVEEFLKAYVIANDDEFGKFWGDSCPKCDSDCYKHLPSQGHWANFDGKRYGMGGN